MTLETSQRARDFGVVRSALNDSRTILKIVAQSEVEMHGDTNLAIRLIGDARRMSHAIKALERLEQY
jgi:hypothetical protein